jgi:hypothetical protein
MPIGGANAARKIPAIRKSAHNNRLSDFSGLIQITVSY